MADATSSAAAQAAASQTIKLENISLPEFAGGKGGAFDYTKWRVRYAKIDMDDAGCRAEIEILETKGLLGIEIVVLSKTSFTFMDKYFIIVTYLELIPRA
jgi:hypothetical protein